MQACEAALVEQQREDAGSAALGTQLGAVCGSQVPLCTTRSDLT